MHPQTTSFRPRHRSDCWCGTVSILKAPCGKTEWKRCSDTERRNRNNDAHWLLRSLHWLVASDQTQDKSCPPRHSVIANLPTSNQLLDIYSPTRQLWPSSAGLLVKSETSNKTSDHAGQLSLSSFSGSIND